MAIFFDLFIKWGYVLMAMSLVSRIMSMRLFFLSFGLMLFGSSCDLSAMQSAEDPYKFGAQAFAQDQDPVAQGFRVFTSFKYKDNSIFEKGVKVVISNPDQAGSYVFGTIMSADQKNKSADVLIGIGADGLKKVNVTFSNFYFHVSWNGSKNKYCLSERKNSKRFQPDPKNGFDKRIFSDVSLSCWYDTCVCQRQASADHSPLYRGYFEQVRERFIQACKESMPRDWFSVPVYFTDYFFVQRHDVSSDTKVIFLSDLHGDIQALMNALNKLQALGYLNDDFSLVENRNIVFLGDYVDRDACGIEVLYTLFRLKIKNPYQVIILRGNHEDSWMNEKGDGNCCCSFATELERKFGLNDSERERMIYSLYNLLPIALYLACPDQDGFMICLCCHGAPELGFSPKKILAADLLPNSDSFMNVVVDRAQALQDLPYDLRDVITTAVPKERLNAGFFEPHTRDDYDRLDLGFLWHDFLEEDGAKFSFVQGRGFKFGETITRKLLARDGISFVMRGHQHGEFFDQLCREHGYYTLFDGLVGTLLSGNLAEERKLFDYSFVVLEKNQEDGCWCTSHKRYVLRSIETSEKNNSEIAPSADK